MSPAHLLVATAASASVMVLPFVVRLIGRWADRLPAGTRLPAAAALVPCLAVLSGAAGLIHLLVIEEHLEESLFVGILFAVLTIFQLVWAVAVLAWPRAGLAGLALIVNAGAIAVWIASRSIGLPLVLEPGEIEPIGIADSVCSAFELLLVAGAAVWLAPGQRRWMERPRLIPADVGLGVAMLSLAVLLVTAWAIGDVAGGAHRHARHEADAAAVLRSWRAPG